MKQFNKIYRISLVWWQYSWKWWNHILLTDFCYIIIHTLKFLKTEQNLSCSFQPWLHARLSRGLSPEIAVTGPGCSPSAGLPHSPGDCGVYLWLTAIDLVSWMGPLAASFKREKFFTADSDPSSLFLYAVMELSLGRWAVPLGVCHPHSETSDYMLTCE